MEPSPSGLDRIAVSRLQLGKTIVQPRTPADALNLDKWPVGILVKKFLSPKLRTSADISAPTESPSENRSTLLIEYFIYDHKPIFNATIWTHIERAISIYI